MTAAVGPEDRVRLGLESTLGVAFSGGNRLDVLRNGVEIFPAMLDAISRAERTVELVTFVYWKGRIAHVFAEALAEKARAGVRVRVLLDAVGSQPMDPTLVETMRRGGAQVERFRPPTTWKLWKVDKRTHRKVLVCDGRVGFTGGVGIAEEWEGDARSPSEWRETHVRVEGPAVRGLRAAFLTNWEETGHLLDDALDEVAPDERPGDVDAAVLRASASPGWSSVATMFRVLIGVARERLRITTGYFVPDEEAVELLCAAARRGVDVRLLLPGRHIDHRVSQLAGERDFQALLDAGVHLHAHARTMVHAKVITVDGLLGVVGSANVNQRSMLKDDEACLLALHRPTAELLDRHFDEDVADAEDLDPARWRRRPAWKRAGARLAGLVSKEI